jgi:predicted alpha/beta-hydrolase family hydrolase
VGTVRAGLAGAQAGAPDLALLAGGMSMGGRMPSVAAAEAPLAGVRGLVFFGFPLHRAGRPASVRGDHLAAVDLPLLFLQGERDQLARLDLLRPLCAALGVRATLETVPDADHGFHVPKRSGRSDAEVITALAASTARWAERIAG